MFTRHDMDMQNLLKNKHNYITVGPFIMAVIAIIINAYTDSENTVGPILVIISLCWSHAEASGLLREKQVLIDQVISLNKKIDDLEKEIEKLYAQNKYSKNLYRK